jgi:hypothetical protein
VRTRLRGTGVQSTCACDTGHPGARWLSDNERAPGSLLAPRGPPSFPSTSRRVIWLGTPTLSHPAEFGEPEPQAERPQDPAMRRRRAPPGPARRALRESLRWRETPSTRPRIPPGVPLRRTISPDASRTRARPVPSALGIRPRHPVRSQGLLAGLDGVVERRDRHVDGGERSRSAPVSLRERRRLRWRNTRLCRSGAAGLTRARSPSRRPGNRRLRRGPGPPRRRGRATGERAERPPPIGLRRGRRRSVAPIGRSRRT